MDKEVKKLNPPTPVRLSQAEIMHKDFLEYISGLTKEEAKHKLILLGRQTSKPITTFRMITGKDLYEL